MSLHAIYWFRNDFRLTDNPALLATLQYQDCLFVCEPRSENTFQNQFLFESVEDLNVMLKRHQQSLYVLSIPLDEFLTQLREKTAEPLILLYTKSQNWRDIQVETHIESRCQMLNIETRSFEPSSLFSRDQGQWTTQNFPRTFTSFRKSLEKQKAQPLTPHPDVTILPKLSSLASQLQSGIAFVKPTTVKSYFKGGPTSAQARLRHYFWDTKKVLRYKETRNGLLEFDDSSKISPFLAMGNISSRWVYQELQSFESEVEANESTYWLYFELLWREYFKLYSEIYGEAIFRLGGPLQKVIPAKQDQELFARWCHGETDEPFVNANMIELRNFGWMSNRGRQNVASYLAKTLQIDWRWGAQWMARHLVDYDAESNWGNWTYLAGVGADPRDRIFNIPLQAKTYDPDSAYTKKFNPH